MSLTGRILSIQFLGVWFNLTQQRYTYLTLSAFSRNTSTLVLADKNHGGIIICLIYWILIENLLCRDGGDFQLNLVASALGSHDEDRESLIKLFTNNKENE